MTRCPNCGSAVRIGAKFCTSCGFRLAVDETASAPAAAPSRSPFATTSSPAWRAEPDPAGAPIMAADPEPVVEPAWSASEPDDSDVVEPQDHAMDVVAVPQVVDREGDDDDEPELRSIGSTDDNDAPGRSWFAPAPLDTSGPVSDDMIASLDIDGEAPAEQPAASVADDEEVPTESVAESTKEATADDREVILTSSIGTPTSGSTVRTTDATLAGHDSPLTTITPPALGQPGDALGEARMLVARLGDLLGSGAFEGLGSAGGDTESPASGVPFESIADQADVDALRTVVASAQGRPRDVDVMLDLVLRADTIAAVIADRDLLIATLRGGEAAVEEQRQTTPEQDDEDEISTYPAWGAP